MSVRIASNISSLQSQRRLGEATYALGKVSEKLSSGLRINRAADDAAGLQISEGLRSDSKVFGQAIRNVNDGLSLLNVAQGAVQQLSNIVIRQAELSEQAINGTYSYKQRQAMNAEANALVREYNRIVATTSFNGLDTLNGITNQLRMQLGYGVNGGIDVGVGNKMGFAAGSGSVAFGSSVGITTGDINSILVSDLNGDGIPDLVTTADGSSTLNVQLGRGDGTFDGSVSFNVGSYTLNAIDDFNQDGIPDLLLSNGTTMSVLTGNGNGTFRFNSTINYNLVITNTGDFNGDGIPDILANNGSNLFILTGNGNGTFNLGSSFATGIDLTDPQVADFNGDGILDIVVSNAVHDNSIFIMLGNGNGTFRNQTTYFTGDAPVLIKIGDFNGDGVNDIAALGGGGVIDILIGNGNGTFRASNGFADDMAGQTFSIADLDGNGTLDLILSYSDHSISIILGNGDGSFRASANFASVTSLDFSRIAVGDFNGDGIPDLAQGERDQINTYLGSADPSGRRNNRMAALDLTTKYGAKQALASSKAALVRINSELGNLGAMQSRLSVANQNLLVSRENYDSARSQLVDADIAQESATLVSTRIKQQAAAAVLAQSNQQPALALKLLSRVGN